MTMSGKALKLIQRSFSDLHLCKDMLVVPPTEHIIRAFTFERTPYKGLFYFWRVVLPFLTVSVALNSLARGVPVFTSNVI